MIRLLHLVQFGCLTVRSTLGTVLSAPWMARYAIANSILVCIILLAYRLLVGATEIRKNANFFFSFFVRVVTYIPFYHIKGITRFPSYYCRKQLLYSLPVFNEWMIKKTFVL